MISPRPPAGMVDLVGTDASEHLRAIIDLRAAFDRYGYQPVIPPVMERAEHFLDRSGEELRSRMYIFTDPGGREICLRPELTIPTVRLYADHYKGDGRLFRGYYVGPVFRYDTRSEGRYRQFTQAGAELIGEPDSAMADAEAVALACHGLRSCGIDDFEIAVGDVSFFTSALDTSGLNAKTLARLTSMATDPSRLASFLDQQSDGDPGDAGGPLAYLSALGAVDPDQRAEIVGGLVRSLHGDDHFGARSIDDVIARTLELAETSSQNRLPESAVDILRQLLAVNQPLVPGQEAVADIAKQAGSDELPAKLAGWEAKVERLDAFGLDVDRIRLDLSIGRGIDYYSGFVFEIDSGPASGAEQLCAGGRYDDLVQSLGGRSSVPAVGFAIGVERVLLAREEQRAGGADSADTAGAESGRPEPSPAADVIVVSGGGVSEIDTIRVVTQLRDHGLTAIHLAGRRVRYALTQALKTGVRYLAVVGEREAVDNLILLRDLDTRGEQPMSPADAAALVAGRSSIDGPDTGAADS